MADSKEHPSEEKTYRLEWNSEDAPPAYEPEEKPSSSNPFRQPSPSPAAHAYVTDHGTDAGGSKAKINAYAPPAGPPPAAAQLFSGAYARMPQAGYTDEIHEKPTFRGSEHSHSPSVPHDSYASSSTTAYAAAPITAGYTYGSSPYESYGARSSACNSPTPVAQSGFGLGGLARGLMGVPARGPCGGSRLSTPGPLSGGRVGLVGVIMSAVEGPRDVLNPPPPSFSRTPQPQFPYSPFPPLVAVSLDKSLSRGFPTIPPTSHLQPHPFTAHDVNEDDWLRFLSDIQAGAGSAVSAMGPRVGLVGMLVGKGIETALRGDKSASVAQVIEHWNAYFFHSRLMEVNLVHGCRVYTNSGRLPQEILQQGYSRSVDEDSSEDSDTEPEDAKRSNNWTSDLMDRRSQRRAEKQARKADRRARKEEKRAMKRERKDNRRNERDAKDEPWKLLITYRPV